jgi:DNA-directed RNA polymerase subunit RPC12/RpoP
VSWWEWIGAAVAEYDPRVDYYAILQVHRKATKPVVKAAYRTILRELRAHPDLGGREDFAKLVNEAFRVLCDPALRREYDGARLLAGGPQGEGEGLEQVVPCGRCGKPNPVALGARLEETRCSYCDALLRHPRATAQEVGERSENVFVLPAEDYRVLSEDSQVDQRVDHVEVGESLRCRYCGYEWTAPKSGRPLRACGSCARVDWHAFRVLKCRVCGHEWKSTQMSSWAYRDHPRCPACGHHRWNSSCELHPFRWLLGVLYR